MPPILAERVDLPTDVFIWAGVLIAAVLVLFAVATAIKRKLEATPGPSGDQPPFTLDELRRMRAAGRIDETEYERARAAIVAMTRGAVAAPLLSSPDASNQRGEEADPRAENGATQKEPNP